MNETDLRTALREYATDFQPAPGWLRQAPRRESRVAHRRVSAAAVFTVVLIGTVIYISHATHSSPIANPRGNVDTVAGGGQHGSPDSVSLELVGYAKPVGGSMPKPLRAHVACMREHGFDLPDPTWTGHGWLITLDDPTAIGLGTQEWKRAAFFTCALMPRRDHVSPLVRHAIMNPRPRPHDN
jgi:hypothetical protein